MIVPEEKKNITIHKKQLRAFITMHKEIKEYVYCLRRFEEIKRKNKIKFCTLPLRDTFSEPIIGCANREIIE